MKQEKINLQCGEMYTLDDFPEPHRSILDACHHSGACDSNVADALEYFTCDDIEGLKDHLKEYGAWNSNELADHKANIGRLLWLVAADIQENGEAYIGL